MMPLWAGLVGACGIAGASMYGLMHRADGKNKIRRVIEALLATEEIVVGMLKTHDSKESRLPEAVEVATLAYTQVVIGQAKKDAEVVESELESLRQSKIEAKDRLVVCRGDLDRARYLLRECLCRSAKRHKLPMSLRENIRKHLDVMDRSDASSTAGTKKEASDAEANR